ncbi:hypothetical protein BER2_2305 [plant metagenome]|uniref:Uncharacterized protein n=1 Tax=plant metagenome TaxID=1297885 RepID=A0A484RGC0_9ZZZZ
MGCLAVLVSEIIVKGEQDDTKKCQSGQRGKLSAIAAYPNNAAASRLV